MKNYKNWKILKTQAEEKADEYSQVAEWCNESGQYTIEEDGEFFKVVAIPEPTPPSEDELKRQIRVVRDSYLQATDFTQLPDVPLEDAQKQTYASYRQYLRDYTNSDEWWNKSPLTFEEWSK